MSKTPRCRKRSLHCGAVDINARNVKVFTFVSVAVAHDIPVLAGNYDTAVFADMAVARRAYHGVIDIPAEALCIIGSLDETAAFTPHAGILAENRRV